MEYIIIAIIIAIFVIYLLFIALKTVLPYALFHPRVNSVLCFLYMVRGYELILHGWSISFGESIYFTAFLRVLFALSFIDCLRDFAMAEKYDTKRDGLYVEKSLTSLVTFGFSRAFYLLMVGPLTAYSVHRGFRVKLKAGQRIYTEDDAIPSLRFKSLYIERLRSHYFQKELSKLEKKGIIVSNSSTVEKENERIREKMKRLRSTAMSKNSGLDERCEKAMRVLFSSKNVTFIPSKTAKKIPELVIEALSERGMCPLSEIKYFDPLQRLNILTYTRDDIHAEEENRWFDYFIIQALSPLVLEGTFEENDYNDNDPLDNHAYQYAKSTNPMKSHSPQTNPLLALDDEDEWKEDSADYSQRDKKSIFRIKRLPW